MSENEAQFGLVMPFVVCASNGGAYDDRSFVAGYTAAATEAALITCDDETYEMYAPPPLIDQLDLIAMRRGWTVTAEPYDNEWSLCIFRKVA